VRNEYRCILWGVPGPDYSPRLRTNFSADFAQ
jgi:hypothetical protein